MRCKKLVASVSVDSSSWATGNKDTASSPTKTKTTLHSSKTHTNTPHVVSKLDTVQNPYCLATIALRQIGLSSQRGGKVCSLSSASRTISGGRRGPKGRRKRPGKLHDGFMTLLPSASHLGEGPGLTSCSCCLAWGIVLAKLLQAPSQKSTSARSSHLIVDL